MRRIVVSAFTSLDGVMQAPGGPQEDASGGFVFGGWVAPYADDALGAAIREVFAQPFDLLLGRRTYDIFAAYWPHVSDPNDWIAPAFNRATKYVAARTNPTRGWQNSQWLGADAVAALKTIKAGDGPNLIVQGSSDLLQTLWREGLVDEFSVLTFPVLLGKGKRLFGGNGAPSALTLLTSKVCPSGVIVAKYRPDGAVKTGDLGAR